MDSVSCHKHSWALSEPVGACLAGLCESLVTSCSLGCLPWQQQWPQCVFMKPPCGFSVIQTPYAMLLASAQLSRTEGKKGGRKQQFSPEQQTSSAAPVSKWSPRAAFNTLNFISSLWFFGDINSLAAGETTNLRACSKMQEQFCC